MRNFISLVEKLLSEIEIGGEVSRPEEWDEMTYEPRQLSLFDVPTEPDLPKSMELLGRLGPYFLTKKEISFHRATYYLFDNGKPVAYISTIPSHSDDFGGGYVGRKNSNPNISGKGLRVISVYVDPTFRGKNLSIELYFWLLKNECDYILPDDLQTPGGVSIWKKMLKDSRFDVMIYNPDKYDYHRAKPGAIWANVYKSHRLRPFVTLAGKAKELIDDDV